MARNIENYVQGDSQRLAEPGLTWDILHEPSDLRIAYAHPTITLREVDVYAFHDQIDCYPRRIEILFRAYYDHRQQIEGR